MAVVVRRSLVALAVSIVIAWAAIAAQTPPPPQGQPPPPPPPVFRAGAVLVTVDVFPQRDGRTVEGLTRDDFQVLEDGKPQPIEAAELVRIERTLSEAERRDPNNVAESWALAADPKNRVFVIYLDALHVSVEGAHNARKPIIDTLNSIIAPNDLFGVMTPMLQARHLALGRRLMSVEEQLTRYWPWGERHRITSDPTDLVEDSLTRCFQYLPLRPGQELTEWMVVHDGTTQRLDKALIERRREDRVLASIEDLTLVLTHRREARTAVILLSDGWRLFKPDRTLIERAAGVGMVVPGGLWTGERLGPRRLDQTSDPSVCLAELARLASLDNAQRFRNLLTQANRANITFYSVATSGLAVFDTPINQRPVPANPTQGSLEIDANRLRERTASLQTLAENTDGLAVVNTNDLAGGMRRIVDDVSSYYLLTYYSTNTRHDGRYRRIEVKTKQPGLAIRARRGYQAPTERDFAASKNPKPPAPAGPVVEPVPVEAIFGPLSRLRPGASSFSYGSARAAELLVAVELGSNQVFGGPFAQGAEVRLVAALVAGGPNVGEAAGKIEPGTRGALIRVPLPAGSRGPWYVTAIVGGGADRIQERLEIREATGKLLGDPMAFRATPAPASPLRAVADFQYRRTERVHIEWPLLAAVDRREARLVGRNGQALPLPVTLSERTDNGQTVIAADVTLAPLTAGDYAIELTVGQGANSERRYVAIRVGQ